MLTEQQLKSIKEEAESLYPMSNANLLIQGEANIKLLRRGYIAAATKYQERINGLLEGLKMLAKEQNRPYMILIAEKAITNYNESLKNNQT